MTPLTYCLLIPLLLISSSAVLANDNSDADKTNIISDYDLINSLNKTLKSELKNFVTPGVKHISTFQKNNQIIIQVTHDPKRCYSNMIKDIAVSASRVNGVNFQNSYTLNIVDSYCKTDLFYTIQGEGLDDEVLIEYEDLKGNSVAQHKISKLFCKR